MLCLNSRSLFRCAQTWALLILGLAASYSDAETIRQPIPQERMAAWHRTVVVTDETLPHSAVFTYVTKRFSYTENNWLAKLSPGLVSDTHKVRAAEAQGLKVEDTSGGVLATFTLDHVKVRTEITPLFVGRGAKTPEGVALYTIQTDPAATIQVEIATGKSLTLIGGSGNAGLRVEDMPPIEGGVQIIDGVAHYRGGEEKIPVAIATSGTLTADNAKLTATLAKGQGHLLIAFAETPERAAELTRLNTDTASRAVSEYYDRLWSTNHIETPESVMDQAFRHALRTMEYTWIEPMGWLECLHHWYSMWHMQATAGAEWVGQTDRSRSCTVEHADRLTPEGAVPQLSPSGHVHRDFGGSNQFWTWQVRHYWHFTGEIPFAGQAAAALDKVLEQTFREYDKDGDLLLSWNLQIGNQEDYVATPYDGTTPAIEGINMMRTRAELARALNDEKTAQLWEDRATRAQGLLRRKLWMPDLGRYAYFVDPQGNRRLDGQYHTLIYPVIWGLTDPLDSYTMLRHLNDRFTGADGEVFCSNNFPNHDGGTWGMQAGAAQQPWAAWALSAAGQFERTCKPLLAAAKWAMDSNKRGSWPEVALEPTPAYFSPPAALFVASVVEALFGLQVDLPAGVLTVSPSLPARWPSAKLQLADFRAEFKRIENRIEYTVESKTALKRRLRWFLPPARVLRVSGNGAELPFTVEPGVDTVLVTAETAAEKQTTFVIEYEPIRYTCEAPLSIAEGESMSVRIEGAMFEQIDDRCGVLAQWRQEAAKRLDCKLRSNLLEPYLPFGRLGRLVFSRRTFFTLCASPEGVHFWHPVDLTILPRYEATVTGSPKQAAEASDLSAQVLVRNNTSSPLQGPARLSVAGGDISIALDVPPRSERTLALTIPAAQAGLLSVGDNTASLTLPKENGVLDTVLPTTQPFETVAPLAKAAKAGVVHIPLDEKAMIPDIEWVTLRVCPAYPHMPWNGSRPPLEGVEKQNTIACPDLPHIDFALPKRKFIPVSFKVGRGAYVLDLKGRAFLKLYLLVIPFLDNHDMFCTVGRVTVRSTEDVIYSRTLRFPGDLDWWFPPAVVREFATVSEGRSDRFGLLPLLPPKRADWNEGLPPAIPQPRFWGSSLAVVTPSSVMNVIEVDLGKPVELTSLTLEAIGVDPSFGIVAVTGLTSEGLDALRDTPWNPPARFRSPRTIFSFEHNPSLNGWRIDGDAFSVATIPTLFMTPTLNSLAQKGEAATGKVISPDFQLMRGDDVLLIQYQGGRSKSDDGAGLLAIDLVDSGTGQRLHRLKIEADHTLRWARIPAREWAGKTVHIELIDQNTDKSFAWLGVAQVKATGE